MSEDELNALIAHAHRRIEQLQKQLAEQMSMERQRLTQALELQKSEDVENTLATVADQQLRLQNEFEAEKHKMVCLFYENKYFPLLALLNMSKILLFRKFLTVSQFTSISALYTTPLLVA